MPHDRAEAGPVQAGQSAIDLCLAEGFALVGICQALPSDTAEELNAWLAAGKHGSMSYLARSAAVRANALLELPSARSVVVVALQYASGVPDPLTPPGAPPVGKVARYARPADYHDLIKARLKRVTAALAQSHPTAEFRKFVDNSPIMEREHAARAGIGWVGKHTLIIHPQKGSYFALGGFLTNIEMLDPRAATSAHNPLKIPDACGTCTRCIDACPTQAITPYSVDGSRCIAYLTIERRDAIPADLRKSMQDWIFGCDICQEVCPHNAPRNADQRKIDHDLTPRLSSIPLLDLLGWTPEDRARELRDTSMKRARLEMLRRNAVIALGNWLTANRDEGAIARLREITAAENESPGVRAAASAVLEDLGCT